MVVPDGAEILSRRDTFSRSRGGVEEGFTVKADDFSIAQGCAGVYVDLVLESFRSLCLVATAIRCPCVSRRSSVVRC